MTQLSGVFMCHHKRCRIPRLWELMRGGKRAKCTGCGDVYPCRGACEHFDCKATRQELGADDEPPVTVREAEPQVEHAIPEPMMQDEDVDCSAGYPVEPPALSKKERDRLRVAAWRAAKKAKELSP